MILAAVLAALMSIVSPGADTQTRPPPPQDNLPVSDLGVVEVTGSRQSLESQARAFVAEVAKAPENAVLGRWNDDLCAGVVNLARPYAQRVADRVSEVALDLGLKVGGPGCRPNVLIVFAADADDVARAMVEQDRVSFLPNPPSSNLGGRALAEFLRTERPIRWWQVSMEVELETGNLPQLVIYKRPNGDEIETPFVEVRQTSRLSTGMRADLQRVIIIVDVNRVRPANLASVADYVAFIAMAQVNPSVEGGGQPSILSLFSDQPSTDRLTDWDMAYLHSLYDTKRDMTRSMQARQIAHEMVDRKMEGVVGP